MQSISNYISEKIRNIAWNYINPATEEKQDAIVSAIEANAPIVWGATEAKQNELIALSEMTVLLKSILGAIQYSRNADMTNNSDRVTVVNTVATTVSSIATLTNMINMNSVDAWLVPRMNEYSAWNLNVRSTIS